MLNERRLNRMKRGCRADAPIVVTAAPSQAVASVRQEYVTSPSSSTVQAPHSPRLHTSFVPVSWRRSRKVDRRVSCPLTERSWATPLTVRCKPECGK